VRIQSAADVNSAQRYGGDCLLADAFVDGALGGTGAIFDWSLVKDLAQTRSLLLAGGLRPSNVAQAIEAVGPYGVDVASGVELAPGIKDLDAVRAFVDAARRAHMRRTELP
jgi:phosphoribosylanthranilate isomerase